VSVHDVAIVGGGLVGASLAIALGKTGKSVALIEAAAPPKSAPAWDERTIALNLASRRIYSNLGLWPVLAPDTSPILATHISERGRFGVARFTAEEAGEEALGWNIPVRALGAALWAGVQAAESVQLLCPARVEKLEVREQAATLTLAGGNTIDAKLVVAADGAHSVIRRELSIGAEEIDYGQVAIVGAVRPARPHKGIAYERFLPEGPIALIPRPENRCVVIWTVASASAPKLLALDDAGFLAALQGTFGQRLGKFLETGRRNGFPLTRVMSDKLTAPRVMFAGNAAQTLHPIAAQGFNLGLRDIATVAELVAAAPDPGAPAVLAQYEQRRLSERARVSSFTDQLVRIFSNAVPGLAGARHWGLLALDLLPPVKRAVMRQNLGYAGGTPMLARE
jgi:2-octaprenyl-6-methoxyphenol hydroxylase